MQLKVKTSQWSAGLPVAMLNKKTAEKLGVHPGDRVTIHTLSSNPKKMATILDTVEHLVNDGYIAVSEEIKKRLSLREGQKVEVVFSATPESVKYIKEKIMGKKLSHEKIKTIIKDVVDNTLSEPEVAVFVSGMYRNGMDFNETIGLVDAILYSGKTMKFKNKFVVDKHCIGGIAGNRTTPIVVAICAAVGLTFPKTSSKAITSAAGTADCIEVLSPIEFSMDQLTKIVKKTGACLSWGGSLGMVPADSKIIKVEKMLKLDPEAQLLASIMSKKLAAGSNQILIDIPYGKGAKVSKSKAVNLKKKFEKLGKHFKVNLKVVLTKAEEPIGNGVGPVLEIIDVLKVLDSKKEGPKDLEKKSIYLAGIIFEMTKKTKKGKGNLLANEILKSGKAFDKFKEIIKAQKGKVYYPKISKICHTISSLKKGKIKSIDNKNINLLARTAGCPLDKFAGVYLYKHVGDKVKKGEELITIYAESKPRLKEALKYYHKNQPIKI